MKKQNIILNKDTNGILRLIKFIFNGHSKVTAISQMENKFLLKLFITLENCLCINNQLVLAYYFLDIRWRL